jgi:hypothetical protein
MPDKPLRSPAGVTLAGLDHVLLNDSFIRFHYKRGN